MFGRTEFLPKTVPKIISFHSWHWRPISAFSRHGWPVRRVLQEVPSTTGGRTSSFVSLPILLHLQFPSAALGEQKSDFGAKTTFMKTRSCIALQKALRSCDSVFKKTFEFWFLNKVFYFYNITNNVQQLFMIFIFEFKQVQKCSRKLLKWCNNIFRVIAFWFT